MLKTGEKIARVMAHNKQKSITLTSVNLRFTISNFTSLKFFVSIAHNVHGLLLCWHFIKSSPEPQPIEKLMMKITTKAHLYFSDRTAADSERNDENMFVSQHSSKPNVSGWLSLCHSDNFTNK